MTNIEDVKRRAIEFMELQLQFFSEMSRLDEEKFGEFMEWFGRQPQNLMLKNFAKTLFAHPDRNMTTRDATSS
jgi:hypothetical protein